MAEPSLSMLFAHLQGQPPQPPMEAKSVASLHEGGSWQFEPKWDAGLCPIPRLPET